MSPSDSVDGPDPVSLDRVVDPAMAVVSMVAEVTGQSPMDMEQLVEAVDPDALNRLVAGPDDRSSSVIVTFAYCGQHVTVTRDRIEVVPAGADER